MPAAEPGLPFGMEPLVIEPHLLRREFIARVVASSVSAAGLRSSGRGFGVPLASDARAISLAQIARIVDDLRRLGEPLPTADASRLLALAKQPTTSNLADLELHPSLSHAQALERPTMLAFDLDPGPPAGVAQCCEVALLLRDLFAELAEIRRENRRGNVNH